MNVEYKHKMVEARDDLLIASKQIYYATILCQNISPNLTTGNKYNIILLTSHSQHLDKKIQIFLFRCIRSCVHFLNGVNGGHGY